MLGRRDPQQSLFSAQNLPHCVPADSFYGRMGSVSADLFQDDDLKALFCADNGRPSLPPSLMSGVLLLQFHDDVSDAEAVERCKYDSRWKVALDLPLDFAGFDPSSLSYFRSRLTQHHQERYAFDRLVKVGRAAGFIPDRVTLLTDTTWAKGAGAVQDTYTLVRKGIRKLLKQLGYALPGKRHGLADAAQRLIATYLEADRKADIDWADPAARAAQLQALVADADAALELALAQSDDPEVRATGWLLTKILGDDLTTNEAGDPQIGQGVAEDRIVSLTDVEMRHGRKSASQRFDGRKLQVAEEQTSELIVAIEPVPANAGDGRDLIAVIDQVEEQTGVTVERAIADGAYGTGDNRADCANRDTDLVSPLGVPHDAAVAKTAFTIDLPAHTVTCPQGHTLTTYTETKDKQGRPVKTFTFDRTTCEACPLFARCVHSKTQGRSITLHYHEDLLQAARRRQSTDEFKDTYTLRPAVERKIAELTEHGAKQARYLGTVLSGLQAQWTGAAVNLKRLFKLFHGDMNWMCNVLMAMG